MAKKRVDKGVPGMELLVCRNPKAAKRYDIEERLEAGMVLYGTEVKSLRARRGNLEAAYCRIDADELFLYGMHIAPYEQGGHAGHETQRRRKLLVHKREIENLRGRLTMRGYALVPLQVYFKNGVAKVQLGLGRGKKKGDERDSIRQHTPRGPRAPRRTPSKLTLSKRGQSPFYWARLSSSRKTAAFTASNSLGSSTGVLGCLLSTPGISFSW